MFVSLKIGVVPSRTNPINDQKAVLKVVSKQSSVGFPSSCWRQVDVVSGWGRAGVWVEQLNGRCFCNIHAWGEM